MSKELQVLGIRGLPPAHGGFETFVGRLAPFLVGQGWKVTVFCQGDQGDNRLSTWRGVDLVHVPAQEGSRGSITFDLQSAKLACTMPGPVLVFGYNTAVFNRMLKRTGKPIIMNMDGIEWQRRKWGRLAKVWFFANEYYAARTATALIADHPAIAGHLATRRPRGDIHMIPYGADQPYEPVQETVFERLGLLGSVFGTIIARPEPENSILEMVQAFSARPRGCKLVVLGKYDHSDAYQSQVLRAASSEVLFPGAIYDRADVDALRLRSSFYLYGHTVGGTSPTLVEALAAGSVPICLDTVYARWVAGDAGLYFEDVVECGQLIEHVVSESAASRGARRAACLRRFREDFTWDAVLNSYLALIEECRDPGRESDEGFPLWNR